MNKLVGSITMAERKIFNYDSNILVDETVEQEGYHPDKWGNASAKFIWASCRFCGKPSRIRKGFFNKSGSACHKKCRLEEQRRQDSPFNNPETVEKAKQTNLKRFGAEHASSNTEIAKKISDTKNTDEYKEKVATTNLKKYGVVNVFQSDVIKDRIKQTNLFRYGHTHAMQNAAKKSQGAAAYKQQFAANPLNKHSIILTLRDQIFWDELEKKGATLVDVCSLFGIDYKDTVTLISRPEFRRRYYDTYSFPKCQAQNEMKKSIVKMGANDVEFNFRKIISPLEIDIWIPAKKVAIEFNGSYWHSEANLQPCDARKKHRNKLDRCREKDIHLLHIFEQTWNERKPQILNVIKSCLGLNICKIPARKCDVNNDSGKVFLDVNHIQGSSSRICRYFNLSYESEIVASMAASLHHRQGADKSAIVLSRLCFKDGCNVQGGSSKLFKHFKEWAISEGYKSIISWSDNCWTEGGIYGILGFNMIKESGPDYFYWNVGEHKYVSKQSQKKSATNCSADMTEREWAMQRGLYRIWDCGKKKWEFKL